MTLAGFIIIGLFIAIAYRLYLWFLEGSSTPDPWGPEVEKELEGEDAIPVCSHCLTPQDHNGWFCPVCGSTVGPFSNYLPFVYPFSIGDALRRGLESGVPSRTLVRAGYGLVGLALLPVVALAVPVYLLFLAWNYTRRPQAAQS